MQTTDLVLAILHHLLAFSLAGVIAAEFVLLRNEITPGAIRRLALIDRHYGLLAVLIILVGIGRVFHGLKGSEFYIYNWVFWTKMAIFATVGMLSIVPTMRFIAWGRQAKTNASYRVPETELATVRRYVWLEALLFLAIPAFAAAMARGYGAF